VLVVDGEAAQRTVLAGFLRKRQLEALAAGSVDEAVQIVSGRTIDLVLTDLNMPGKDGLALIDGLRAINPELPVIVMTAFGTVASAVDAMKRGAADYLTKPIDLDELDVLVTRTLERRALLSENALLKEQLASRYRLAGLETANAKMSEAINTAARAAASRATILVRGESRWIFSQTAWTPSTISSSVFARTAPGQRLFVPMRTTATRGGLRPSSPCSRRQRTCCVRSQPNPMLRALRGA
jgi:DNA-binding NtrC family response regulator